MTSVYLDTQHLSRAVSGKNNLKHFFQSPHLEFFFSITHVVESLPKTSLPNANAIARLELMMGRYAKSLARWSEVVELEKRGKVTRLADLIIPAESMFPHARNFNRVEMVKNIRNKLKQRLKKTILDPNLRRSAQAKLFKHGKIRPELMEALTNRKAEMQTEAQGEIPDAVPLLEEGGLYDFLQGRMSESDFTIKFRKALVTPGGSRATFVSS